MATTTINPTYAGSMMSTKQAFLLTVICCALIVAAAVAQTQLNGPTQVKGIPNIWGQFGFACDASPDINTNIHCRVDSAYMLHLEPIPFDGTHVAPSPGPCPSTGSVIVTPEPAAYFCTVTAPGSVTLNWIRVAGVKTW